MLGYSGGHLLAKLQRSIFALSAIQFLKLPLKPHGDDMGVLWKPGLDDGEAAGPQSLVEGPLQYSILGSSSISLGFFPCCGTIR